MRRRGLACLRSIALARGAAEASPLARHPASMRRSFAPSSSVAPSSWSPHIKEEEQSSQRPRRPPARSRARTLPPRRRFDAVLLDATGTLISPSEPAAEVKKRRDGIRMEKQNRGGEASFFLQRRRRRQTRFSPLSLKSSSTSSSPPLFFSPTSPEPGLPPLRRAPRPRPSPAGPDPRGIPQGLQRSLAAGREL